MGLANQEPKSTPQERAALACYQVSPVSDPLSGRATNCAHRFHPQRSPGLDALLRWNSGKPEYLSLLTSAATFQAGFPSPPQELGHGLGAGSDLELFVDAAVLCVHGLVADDADDGDLVVEL